MKCSLPYPEHAEYLLYVSYSFFLLLLLLVVNIVKIIKNLWDAHHLIPGHKCILDYGK